MNNKDKKELNKMVNEIDCLHLNYLKQLKVLQAKQNISIKEFIKKVENKKIDDIRKKILN